MSHESLLEHGAIGAAGLGDEHPIPLEVLGLERAPPCDRMTGTEEDCERLLEERLAEDRPTGTLGRGKNENQNGWRRHLPYGPPPADFRPWTYAWPPHPA